MTFTAAEIQTFVDSEPRPGESFGSWRARQSFQSESKWTPEWEAKMASKKDPTPHDILIAPAYFRGPRSCPSCGAEVIAGWDWKYERAFIGEAHVGGHFTISPEKLLNGEPNPTAGFVSWVPAPGTHRNHECRKPQQ